MDFEKDDKDEKGTKAPGASRVIVEGEPADLGNEAITSRTPRDVAVRKTREGEDVGLEGSKPDRTEPIALPARLRGAKEFVDASGQHWVAGELDVQKAPQLDPDAIRKDGGDPGTLNIPPNRSGERYAVPGASNESFSPEGVMNRETGEIREKTVEEGGVEPQDAKVATLVPTATKLGDRKASKAAPAKASKATGRGGSSAKAKAQKTNRGGAKARGVKAKK